jgi:hypothetical protein
MVSRLPAAPGISTPESHSLTLTPPHQQLVFDRV